jgi:hypothetical protein
MAIINFDATQVAPDAGLPDALQAGWYAVIAKAMEVKPGDNGWSLATTFEVVEPPKFKGRKVFHNFNMENTSEKAQNIGRAQMSALCHAVGVLTVQDTAVLYDKPLKVKLSFVEATGQYAAKNEVKAFKPMSEEVTLGPVTGAAPAAGARPPAAAPVAPPPMQQPQYAPPPAAPMQPPMQPPMQNAPAPVQYQQPLAQAPQMAQPPMQQQQWNPAAQDPSLSQIQPAQQAQGQQPWNGGAQAPAQPWSQPQAAAPAPVQQPPMQQAPMQQAPAGQPAWAAAPAYDPNAASAGAQHAGAPVQQMTTAPVQQMTTAPSPEATAAQTAPPPWAKPPGQ